MNNQYLFWFRPLSCQYWHLPWTDPFKTRKLSRYPFEQLVRYESCWTSGGILTEVWNLGIHIGKQVQYHETDWRSIFDIQNTHLSCSHCMTRDTAQRWYPAGRKGHGEKTSLHRTSNSVSRLKNVNFQYEKLETFRLRCSTAEKARLNNNFMRELIKSSRSMFWRAEKGGTLNQLTKSFGNIAH